MNKLNVGCGKKIKEGYKHQDIIQYPHINYCSPCWKVGCSNETFDEIYSRHLFEHLYPWEAEDTLKEWKRILKPNGKIIIILPNLEFHAKQLLLNGKSKHLEKDISNFDHAMNSIFGWIKKHKNGPYEAMSHKWGYTQKSLTELILKYFKKIKFNSQNIRDLEATVWK